MFDRKKRNSMTLKSGRESEEFRRVAVRRRVVSGVGDCPASDVSGGVFGSYSCDPASGKISGIKCNYYVKSPAQTSPLKPQVPPKPAHLQSPPRDGEDPACSSTDGKITTDQDQNLKGASVSCFSPTQSSPSPVRGRRSQFLRRKQISPARPNLSCSPALGSPSPGKRGIESRSPLREGGHSPAKLSPRNPSTLMGKLRTPSPVQRMRSHNPPKSSISWLGLHRMPNERTERLEKSAGKSSSVPDLIVHMDESRSSTDKVERSPLKALQTPNRTGPAAKTKHRVSLPFLSSSSAELLPGDTVQPKEWPVITINGVERKTPVRQGSRCSCKWTNVTSGNEQSQEEPGGEQIEEKREEKKEKEEEVGGGEGGEGGGKDPKDTENTEQKVYKIANELLQTERAYVSRLHLLDQVFCSRLTEEAGRGSFPPDVIRNIFSNVSSIYSFHSQFLLPDLEKCLRQWGEGPGLGEVLLQHAPFLRMYADYVKNFDQAMELVRTWTERSSSFKNIIQDIQSQEVCGSLTLQHHMLEPVQRVPRYEMLLKDYLKKLPEDNPDYDLAQKSLQSISMAATHSNSAIHKAECLKRLLEIYEMVGDEEVVNPTNEFLKEGRLLKLAARNASAMERHLFLFNNFLLCCSPKFSLVGQRLAVRCRIGMEGLQVLETTNEDHPYTFQVSGKEKTLELQASSEQDRDDWIKVIQEAVDVFEKKNETFKLASKELDMDERTEELGRRAPRWIRDNEVTMCMTCWEPFNALTRRRHHCRACGFVVCWRCSDNKVALEYDGNKLNKVCKSCYSILKGPRTEGEDGKKRHTLESEVSPGSSDSVMSGFLLYGDNPVTWQRLWASLIRSDPPVLHLYTAPKDVKPLFSIPLLACSIQTSPLDLQSLPCFHLKESNTSHFFSCDAPDLRKSWLTAIEEAVMGGTSPTRQPSVSDITGSKSDCDGNVDSGPAEKCVTGGNNENHS